jgi:beta-mannosidase
MACSGGWDWAPYTNVTDAQGLLVFTKGIWKDVYLVRVGAAAISHVVPQVMYLGEYPTKRLVDGEAPFEVKVEVHLTAPKRTTVSITAGGSWGSSNTTTVAIPAGESTAVLVVPAHSVQLWWPNNAGNQTLYDLTVSLTHLSGPAPGTFRRP